MLSTIGILGLIPFGISIFTIGYFTCQLSCRKTIKNKNEDLNKLLKLATKKELE